jgi:hypothetical protein
MGHRAACVMSALLERSTYCVASLRRCVPEAGMVGPLFDRVVGAREQPGTWGSRPKILGGPRAD